MIYAIEAQGSLGPCTRESHTPGLVKIGKANNPEMRAKVLATGTPYELRLLASMDWPDEIERLIHAAFRDLRRTGEWFHPDEWMMSFVSTMMCPHGATDEEKFAICMRLLVERLSGWRISNIDGGKCCAPDKRTIILEDGSEAPNPDWPGAEG